MSEEHTAQEQRLAPEEGANVILARNFSPITVPSEEMGHEGEVNIGLDISLKLPSEAQQRAGFKCDNAKALLNQFPGRYKRFQPKALPVAQPEESDESEGEEGRKDGEA
jgi:hypothetical protein